MSQNDIPAAVFLPPAVEHDPDLSLWLPADKHRTLQFLAPAGTVSDR
jgi:hypothetical protein